jgi:2-polyprenyl-6-methoxyphenol hydroxylase-like FAD-dependent oxidoreductase
MESANSSQNKETMTDVLIVGAGASGLTLAIELARRNISFRLIEKLPAPFHGSRGKGIQPRTQEVFEDLGIVDRLFAVGGLYPLTRSYTFDGSYKDEQAMTVSDPSPYEPYLSPLMVPQSKTEQVMRDRLAELGHAPQYGCELITFEQDEAGVTAHISNGDKQETIRVKYLVAGDGGRSHIRHILKIEFPGKTLGVRAMVADIVIQGDISRDVWHRWGEKDMHKQLMLCPLPRTNTFQLQGPVPLEGDIDTSPQGLTTILKERTGRDFTVETIHWSSVYNMGARLADQYQVGRVFLIGDAAHIHPPTGGQGLNTSVQDAYNLGWKLAAVLQGAPENLLVTYEQERRPIAADMLGMSSKMLEQAKEGIMRRGREAHQLELAYHDSTLSLENPKREEGLKAGDRAPDAPVLGASNVATRLFSLFRGPHWTLLGYETKESIQARPGLHIHNISKSGEIQDVDGHFKSGYKPNSGDWILVRPDGYIGAIVNSTEALETYLENVGLKHT